ncbi:hypothetical protein MTR_3g116670 [Medicago truncatula]|uniref:Uncharacterized protein n=1 Tax=Medicago truncatula TaxID=3880 RepID=G7J728_MEDTR|nr:hypothetical protein MTR_3g116670 [Medicago truncatula]
MPRVPIKKSKKLYSQRATSSKKGDTACHISKNAQSGAKPKVTYITGGKDLLTQDLIQLRNPKTRHFDPASTTVKSPISDRTWPDNVFISGGNPHLTSRFCGVVLGPTTISKMVSEPLQDPLSHLLSGFRYFIMA